MFVTIEAEGRLTVNDRETSIGELGPTIVSTTGEDREQRVFLRADRTLPHERLMDAMNAMRASGYLRVALVGAEDGAGR